MSGENEFTILCENCRRPLEGRVMQVKRAESSESDYYHLLVSCDCWEKQPINVYDMHLVELIQKLAEVRAECNAYKAHLEYIMKCAFGDWKNQKHDTGEKS